MLRLRALYGGGQSLVGRGFRLMCSEPPAAGSETKPPAAEGGGRRVNATKKFTMPKSQATVILRAHGWIKSCMSDTGTKIWIDGTRENEQRNVSIIGDSEEACEEAMKRMLDFKPTPGGGRRGGPSPEQDFFQIHKDAASMLIGKQGSQIRKIQELSGAQIYVDPRADDGVEATMRNVTIQGNSEQMSKAKELVNEIVARHKQQEQSRKENPTRGDLPMQDFFAIPSNVVSSIIGRGGSSIKAMKDETGCSIFIENKADDGGVESVERKVTIRGNVENVKRARFLIEEKVKEAMQSNVNFLTGGGGGGPGGGRGKGPGNRRNKLFQNRGDGGDEEATEGGGIMNLADEVVTSEPPSWAKAAPVEGEEKAAKWVMGLVNVDVVETELLGETDKVKMSKATRAEIENIAQVLSMNPGMDGNSKVRLLKQLTRMLEKPMPEHLNILNMGSSE